jgi:PKD repeat protein
MLQFGSKAIIIIVKFANQIKEWKLTKGELMKTKLIRAISLSAIAILAGLGFLTNALQTNEEPDWLIRSSIEDSLIQISLSTDDGELFEDDEFFEFISFTLSAPAYVYLFNISPTDADADGIEQIHLLLPNVDNADNFFEAGEHAIDDPFVVLGPGGEAYIQAIATPFPLDVFPSSTEEFTFLGNDPSIYFQGLQFLIESKGLTTSEWAADWVSYRVATGGVMPLAAGSRCSKMQINVPQAAGNTVFYTIDSSCVNGEPISKFFNGPTSEIIAQVREGERTVRIITKGFETDDFTQRVQFGRVAQLNVANLVFAPVFDINSFPEVPTIWEDITFSPNVETSRQIATYIWDFGDGSELVEGEEVAHSFSEGIKYRISLTIVFADEVPGEEGTQIVTKTLEIGIDPNAGACPPDTFTVTEFPTSLLIESLDLTGCVSATVPASLISEIGSIAGLAELTNQFTWGSMPEGANVQANLFVRYSINGEAVNQESRISLLPASQGIFNREFLLDVPDNADIELNLVVNLIDNPTGGDVSLEVGPFEVFDLPEVCAGARLVTRNLVTNSTGEMNFFSRSTPVEIVFQNFNCDTITVNRDSLIIVNNGVEIRNLQIDSFDVEAGNELVFDWDQLNFDGTASANGLYEISIETNSGSYIAKMVIIN